MRPLLAVWLPTHGDLSGSRAGGGALEAEAVDLEREAVGGERVPAGDDPEMQVRSAGVPTVAEQSELLSGADALAHLDAGRARLEVVIVGEHTGPDPLHDAVARVVPRLVERGVVVDERRNLRAIVLHCDDRSVRDRVNRDPVVEPGGVVGAIAPVDPSIDDA